MKCPHCGKTFASPMSRPAAADSTQIVMIGCPFCYAILGAVKRD